MARRFISALRRGRIGRIGRPEPFAEWNTGQMNRKDVQASSVSASDTFLIGVEAALRRSAARALSIARATGTPCWVWQDGRIVDLAAGDEGPSVRTEVPGWDYNVPMRVIALSTLKAFWVDDPECQDVTQPALAWYRDVLKADWATPATVKSQFRSAGILKDGRVVFNLAGNKYRLVVWINYPYRVVYIRFIGTHQQYDAVDAQTI
jgi:mRNA interferase HigB